MSTISLMKSLRTDKVGPGVNNFASYISQVDNVNVAREIPIQLYDIYGRDVPISGGLNWLGPGAAGVTTPEYMIQLEDAVSRPQYGVYLDVPQGVMKGGISEYNNPTTDTMFGTKNLGRGNLGVFGISGEYRAMSFPENATNPSSDKQNAEQMEWYAQQTQTQFRNRVYLNSAYASSGM